METKYGVQLTRREIELLVAALNRAQDDDDASQEDSDAYGQLAQKLAKLVW